MPTGTTSYFAGFKFSITDTADCSETSYSSLHPPNSTATVIF
jgi:hypothetical protein